MTRTTHKSGCKFPSESPCLRSTSSAACTHSRFTNKTPSRRWPPIPSTLWPTNRTGPDYCQSSRHHTSICVTNCLRSNRSTKRGGGEGGYASRSATLGTSGCGAFATSAVFCCGSAEQSMGCGSNEKIQMENLDTLKLNKCQALWTQNWFSPAMVYGRIETCSVVYYGLTTVE